MAHGVHPSVKGVEPARADPSLDRPRSNPGRDQLTAPDHAVLLAGQGSDHLVEGERDGFAPYAVVKPSHLAHDPRS